MRLKIIFDFVYWINPTQNTVLCFILTKTGSETWHHKIGLEFLEYLKQIYGSEMLSYVVLKNIEYNIGINWICNFPFSNF